MPPLKDELSTTVFGGEEEPHGSDSAERRKCSHRALLEKKLSIAERAVATNPCSISLQLERLKICQELWEPSLLAKEWKKLVSLQFWVKKRKRFCTEITKSLYFVEGVPPPKQCPPVEGVFAFHSELLQQLHCDKGERCLWEVSEHAQRSAGW